jgi:hypothetical protein
MHFQTFTHAIRHYGKMLKHSYMVHPKRWQGFDVANRPEAAMQEILFTNFSVSIYSEDLTQLRSDVHPNLPWADDHFLERVSGQPLNPGEQWKHWPYALSAQKSLDDTGRFNHTYMERYWPRYAGYPPGAEQFDDGLHGIRYRYGDLNDLIAAMVEDPLTRQAYLPIFFPEDTGVANPHRKPCTLGYHWIMRDDELHTTYYIRSCDYIRHFADDIYLTVRLTLWLLAQLRNKDSRWNDVRPGRFRMDIGSLHCFVNDVGRLP